MKTFLLIVATAVIVIKLACVAFDTQQASLEQAASDRLVKLDEQTK